MAPTSTAASCLLLAADLGTAVELSKNGWRDQYRPCAAASLRSAPNAVSLVLLQIATVMESPNMGNDGVVLGMRKPAILLYET